MYEINCKDEVYKNITYIYKMADQVKQIHFFVHRLFKGFHHYALRFQFVNDGVFFIGAVPQTQKIIE